ncbi:ATP-binding protein [Alicyclobacillus sp. ALC3]|uniref:ATP-binding protein n=1 Tax=Alicyclobacillus sp. ALC3 TaxID=2796143 RepID=UPI002378FBCD|nr:ATP-binding protein [Alicyclobacillus sp. ALC3]WDL99106.1 hypothetical protein JC200_10910 [Alicyclobacillus sp. ALC3]
MANRDMEARDREEELRDRLSSVGQIAAGIAHEIRNPLTTVLGFLTLLREEHEYQHWDVVFSELNQALVTVQSLLAVSKPALDSEAATDFPLCVEVENVLALFQHNTYEIQFEKKWSDRAARIRGKRNQIKQALFNLIKNASEAIEGSGTVTIEHYRTGDTVVLSIRDTGVGIAEQDLQRLGTPFFTTKTTGTGMGLTQVYSVLHENQATVQVSSKLGEGTTFTIRFPISPIHQGEDGGTTHVTDVVLQHADDIRDFFRINQKRFAELLEQQAPATFQVVAKSKFVTKQDLLNHARQITELIHEDLTQDIVEFAQERGTAWAKSDIPIISKMEWFYALRKVIWMFLERYYEPKNVDAASVFAIADRTSEALDTFIIHFNVSFTKYREEVLNTQKAMIEQLTVPVIPLLDGIGVLPIVGTLDNARLQLIEGRLLEQLHSSGMRKIFIDLSGTFTADDLDMGKLDRILLGATLLGCEAVFTGMNAQTARRLLHSDCELAKRIKVEATLQQALQNALHGKAPVIGMQV